MAQFERVQLSMQLTDFSPVPRVLGRLGSDAPVVVGDVTRPEGVDAFTEALAAYSSRLDALVDNVGDVVMPPDGGPCGTFVESDAEEWDALYAVDLRQLFAVSRGAPAAGGYGRREHRQRLARSTRHRAGVRGMRRAPGHRAGADRS